MGHPVLRERAKRVERVATPELRALVQDMKDTMAAKNGAGLAAPQIGVGERVVIFGVTSNPRYPDAPSMDPEVVINPEILDRSAELVKGWEGCLSIPGIRGEVPRHRWIRVRYHDLEGAPVERELADFVARIFQHEYDHLHGIVFLDRLESVRDIVSEREYQKRFAHP